MLRKPAVAGYFYQASPDRLKDQVQKYGTTHSQKTRALGVISPHAGFIYSGAVAGAVYSGLILPDTFILIGPNHTGTGAPVSVFPEGRWEMPNGEVEVDAGIAKSLAHKAREKILALDPAGLHAVVKECGITMCGFAPAVTMLYAAMDLGATKATLVKYMNSGDTSGDYDQG